MKNTFFACLFAPFLASSQKIQLAPPQLRLADGSDFFFEKKAEAQLVFDLEGAEIRFTLDGSEPTEKSQKANGPLVLTKTTTLRAAAFHPDFSKSEARNWAFEKVDPAMRPDTVWLAEPPSAGYETVGAAALFDLQKASENNFGDGRWLGFEGKNAAIVVGFAKKRRFSKIRFHCLVDEKSWIFPPKAAYVFAISSKGTAGPNIKFEADPSKKGSFFFDLDIDKKQRFQTFYISLESFGPLPEGHAGAGRPAWLFLDEVVFEK